MNTAGRLDLEQFLFIRVRHVGPSLRDGHRVSERLGYIKTGTALNREERRGSRFLPAATLLLAGLPLVGCGAGDGRTVVYGSVSVADTAAVVQGDVSFVPVDGAGGAGGVAEIVDGEYRVETHGGLLPGKYRVVVNAWAKTERKVKQSNGFEVVEVDELKQVGNPIYAGYDSPLTFEARGGGKTEFPITLQ